MTDKNLSKFLSLLLRHKPEVLELNMTKNGWVDLDELIEKITLSGKETSLEQIHRVVANNDKKRFKLDLENNRIRANQGHSIEVEMGFEAKTPPDILYHGTAISNWEAIQKSGLLKMSRQHVHLSPDIKTAKKVGGRHGKPVSLVVRTGRMVAQGISFFLSENGVWLTDHVAPEFVEYPIDKIAIATQFGSSLDSDQYEETAKVIADDCKYIIGEEVLIGPKAICGSYEQNMLEGRAKLDKLVWGKCRIEMIDYDHYFVHFTDYLGHKGEHHTHCCKQKLTISRKGEITKIEHIHDAEEQGKLDAFYRKVGLK